MPPLVVRSFNRPLFGVTSGDAAKPGRKCQSRPDSCYRKQMAKDDLAKLEGTVVEARGGGTFVVRLENGQELAAKLGGGMRRFRIRVIVGDRVTIGVSPYDPSHGLILFRAKNES